MSQKPHIYSDKQGLNLYDQRRLDATISFRETNVGSVGNAHLATRLAESRFRSQPLIKIAAKSDLRQWSFMSPLKATSVDKRPTWTAFTATLRAISCRLITRKN